MHASEGPLFTGLVSVSVASARRSRLLPRSWAAPVPWGKVPLWNTLKYLQNGKTNAGTSYHQIGKRFKVHYGLTSICSLKLFKIQLLLGDFDEQKYQQHIVTTSLHTSWGGWHRELWIVASLPLSQMLLVGTSTDMFAPLPQTTLLSQSRRNKPHILKISFLWRCHDRFSFCWKGE